MQRIARFFGLLLLIGDVIVLVVIGLGILLRVPGFEQFAANWVFFFIAEITVAGIGLIVYTKAKNETSIKIPKGASRAVEQAIKALDSNDPNERKNAIESLGQMNDPTARETLVGATKHPHKDVCFEAAFKLAKLGDDKGIPIINEALKGDDRNIQIEAINALTQLGARAIPSFITALNNWNPEIRLYATKSLGQSEFRSADSVDGLLKCLDDKDGKVRYRAAESLDNIGDKRAKSGLLKALEHEDDRNVISVVITALGKLGDASIVPILVPIFKRRDNTTGMKIALVTALRRIGTPEALEAVEPYRDDFDWEQNI